MHGHRWHSLAASWILMRALLIWGLGSSLSLAQAPRFAVEILGAGELTSLLEAHLLIIRATNDAAIREEEWQGLMRRSPQQIRELLSTEGYFSAQVLTEEVIDAQPRLVRFRVRPGEPVRVTDVQLELTSTVEQINTAHSSRLQTLQQQWSLRPGARFTQAEWDRAKTALLNNLLEKDFPAARLIDSEANIDPETNSARLRVMMDSGPAFTLGDLDI